MPLEDYNKTTVKQIIVLKEAKPLIGQGSLTLMVEDKENNTITCIILQCIFVCVS